MNDLQKFQKFAKKQEVQKINEKDVWAYTRVSSIDQKDNYSLEIQKNCPFNDPAGICSELFLKFINHEHAERFKEAH